MSTSDVSKPGSNPFIEAGKETGQVVKAGVSSLVKDGIGRISSQYQSYKKESESIESIGGKTAHGVATVLFRAPAWVIGSMLKASGIAVSNLATLIIGTPLHYLSMVLEKSDQKNRCRNRTIYTKFSINLRCAWTHHSHRNW